MIGVKIPSELTDVAIGQYITTVVSLLQLEINRRLQFWRGNPSQLNCSRSYKLPRDLYRFEFKLPRFTFFIRQRHIFEFKLRLRSQTIFETRTREPRKRKSRSLHWSSTSTSALDSLIVEISESPPFSSNWSLSFSFIGGTSVLDILQPLFLITMRQCDPWSLKSKDLARHLTNGFHKIFDSSASSETKIGKSFLAFTSWHKKNFDRENESKIVTCDETTTSRTVRVHKWSITPQ